jgi:hypothetical protein
LLRGKLETGPSNTEPERESRTALPLLLLSARSSLVAHADSLADSPVLSRPRVSCTGSGREKKRLVAPCRSPETCCQQHAGANRHQPATLPDAAASLGPASAKRLRLAAGLSRFLLVAPRPGCQRHATLSPAALPDTQASTLKQKLPALPAGLQKTGEAAARKPSSNANRKPPAALSVTRDRPVLQFESRLRGPRSPDRENAMLARPAA